MFEFSIVLIVIMISTILLHELGHILYLKSKKIPYEKKGLFKLVFDDKSVPIPQQLGIYWSGILLGMLPIFLLFYLIPSYFSSYGFIVSTLWAGAYVVYGCDWDLKQISKLEQLQKKEDFYNELYEDEEPLGFD